MNFFRYLSEETYPGLLDIRKSFIFARVVGWTLVRFVAIFAILLEYLFCSSPSSGSSTCWSILITLDCRLCWPGIAGWRHNRIPTRNSYQITTLTSVSRPPRWVPGRQRRTVIVVSRSSRSPPTIVLVVVVHNNISNANSCLPSNTRKRQRIHSALSRRRQKRRSITALIRCQIGKRQVDWRRYRR